MAKEFFHRDMQLFIDKRFDWARYLRLRRGEAHRFIHRHIPAVRVNAERISTGDASRIARYDKILGLSANPT